MTPHHIGCAVTDLEASAATYCEAFGLERRSRCFDIASQHVRVCFLELLPGFYFELVGPLDEDSKLEPFLRAGFYHLCFLVDDLGAASARLQAQHFHALPAFSSEAFAGAPTQFLMSPRLHLIELAQMSPGDFAAFFAGNLR